MEISGDESSLYEFEKEHNTVWYYFKTPFDCDLTFDITPVSLKDDYDFILIDCSPSLGLIVVNALTASDSVLIPVQCEYFALEGLGKLLNTIRIVQGHLNPELDIEGFLMTMYDSRLRLSDQILEEVKKHFDKMVFETVVHRNVKLGEAPSFGQSIFDYDIASKGATNYLNVARELLQRNNMTKINEEEKILN
jgi:chromosome partitioning protein